MKSRIESSRPDSNRIYRSRSALFYCLFRFFQDLALIYPMYLILFRRQGLSFPQIAVLLAVWAGAGLLLEVPSGILADLWSRRAVVALSMALKAGGFLIWTFRPDFTGFLLGFIAWGTQEALCSGTTDALLFDALKLEKRESAYEAAAGAGEMAARAAIASAVIAGGFLFDRNPRLVLVLSALPMLGAGLSVLGIAEKRDTFRPGRRAAGAAAAGFLRQVGPAVRAVAAARGLALFVLAGSAVGAVYGTVEEFDSMYGVYVGVPVGFIGLWSALRYTLEGFGAALAPLLRRRLALHRTGRLMLWMLAAGLALLFGTLSTAPWALPLYFLYYAMAASALVVYQGALQRRIGSAGRATVSSLASFLVTVLAIGAGILLGLAAGRWGLPALFRAGALMTAGAVGLHVVFSARRPKGRRRE